MTMDTKIETPEVFWGRGVMYQRRDDGAYRVLCSRCGGSGYIPSFGYVEGGVCFKCNGHTGALSVITSAKAASLWKAQVKYAEKKEAKRLAVVAERDARVARLTEAHPAVAEVLQQVYDTHKYRGRSNPFLSSLADQVFPAEGHDLSEKQVGAVEKMLAQDAERDAAKADDPPVVEGRGVVTGEIISVKRVYNDYGDAVKVTIKDDRGFRVYGTLARDLVKVIFDRWLANFSARYGYHAPYGGDQWFEDVTGTRVTFTATVVASLDDKAFGFFSRPTKAALDD